MLICSPKMWERNSDANQINLNKGRKIGKENKIKKKNLFELGVFK